ncbi:polyketide synthase [Rhizodiscina lignyota]|uniref:Polyketide synthase n=1 Tax=Rhizodiscina lignyota TaxID=1504668 RepID=A0A9P4II11_9PEZI|nr:polyketide synthase [Rhizodiscina lignyota]
MAESRSTPEPIAIVGSSCRFPGGASSPSKLWELLKNPRDVLVEIPPSRFNAKGFYHENGEYHGSTNVLHSYLLTEDHRVFDNNFFKIHPKEAESMDPQQRMLLETVYEGMDAAGYSIQELQGTQTAVFVGQMTQDYSDLLLRDVDSVPQYAATGLSRAILSNRVSYFFDWKGPSTTIDTACSSSLVALHHAVQTLRSGESNLAVAAGVNLILGPDPYILESKLHMLSPTGRSRMWDADADGYARGEGFAAVFLKTLTQAIADGDHIECIVRETGVNQDGRTSGITVPSAMSQTALIRSTYARAGLDCRRKEDRCQYFEAHGTGTMAGDPIEAEAVQGAFFATEDPEDDNEDDIRTSVDAEERLYIGSVKTVIGHLEGTAGLAGLLKASLAVQHGLIPPNMHFNRLNPRVAPFYTNLCIPTEIKPWPVMPPGVPRRASVNSFGFGGTNAHAILESWTPEATTMSTSTPSPYSPKLPCGPLVLSANSESALLAGARSLSGALKTGQTTDLSNLAWTLQTRRTELPYKTYVSSSTAEELAKKLDDLAAKAAQHPHNSIATKAIHVTEDLPPRILGIFTGQGAQWPSMGASLYAQSSVFKQSIDALEESLQRLPDSPSWSLAVELTAPVERSRIHEAEISQPLCTALQVALINLLHASGITFSAVIGHSSGEIAAAYAAGYLEASDAIRIAYYRGVYAHLAGLNSGKMMAVGMSLDQARAFCTREQFAGRIQVAASNSRSSVTLSGDADAIDEAKELLNEEQTFARVLKVDKAYHSHHMNPCAGPYLESLRNCDIRVRKGQLRCKWYSSVYGSNGRSIDEKALLNDTYWVDNMTKPVLFSQALERAVTEEHCHDIALEVGPHAALKAPASESLKTLTGLDIPYCGVLSRGKDDMDSFADALGFIWSNFLSLSPVVDFSGFRKACLGDSIGQGTVLKGLPPYAWDHSKHMWRESRKSRQYRSRESPIHELLGSATSHGGGREVIWRNVMRVQEMEWLRGHMFQGQILFPAAGYVSMAYEAAMRLTTSEEVRLVELEDLAIHRAITLEEDSAGTEVTFTIRVTGRSPGQIVAEYSCYSCKVDGDAAQELENMNFTGRAIIRLGTPAIDVLPARNPPRLPMKPVSVDRLYSYMEQVGLRYTGDFTVDSVQRRLNVSTVTLKRVDNSRLRLHPATLDSAFHGLFTALAFPGDGRLWTPYLPTNVQHIRINPVALEFSASPVDSGELVADCYLTKATSKVMSGDVNITSSANGHPQIQLRALTCSSFTKATPQNDRKLFAKTVWKRDVASGIEPKQIQYLTAEEVEYVDTCERLAYYYLRRLRDEISPSEIPELEGHFQIQIDWILNYLLPKVEAGRHPRIKKEWAADTREELTQLKDKYPGMVELEMITALGQVQPAILRGELPALQVMMQNDMLTRLYAEAVPFRQTYSHLAAVSEQLAHRYPHMKVLEIGAGTGGATIHMLKGLGSYCHSYTYTDISAGFFESARTLFSEHSALMEYAVLDIEASPRDQGFEDHSYDVIMSSNALHATKSLAETLAHCRSLLKPGGFLILNEVTNDGLTPQFTSSHLPGWWLGRDDGRMYHPTVDEDRWNEELLATGFSGVDAAYRDHDDPKKYLASLIVSQAIDERVEILRDPLSCMDRMPHLDNLLIVGGESRRVAKLVQKARSLLQPIVSEFTLARRLEDVEQVPSGAAVLVLSELDAPMFGDVNPAKFRGAQAVFQDAKHVLWVVTFSASPRSLLSVSKEDIVPLDGEFDTVKDAQALLGTLIAESLVWDVKGPIWVHDADPFLAKLIACAAAERGVIVFLSTSSGPGSDSNSTQAFIHPYATDRELQSIVPTDIQAFVNFGEANNLVDYVTRTSNHEVETRGIIGQGHDVNPIVLNYDREEMIRIATRSGSSPSLGFVADDVAIHEPIPVNQVARLSGPVYPTTVLRWEGVESVDIKISPLNAFNLFSENKTYLLVGLASELGLSICDWMVTHGARHIAITSRNPKVDAEVLKDLQRRGANIRVLPLDISDKEAVLRIYGDLCATMPPIAGVANAAMVLNDKLFTNMSLEDFEVALRPKVDGTRNLDELFYSTQLDFFICFSSLSCVMGNPGQSNYAAANMYMHALTRQRRQRGVAASIMDIAFLLGIGFVARNLEQYEEHLNKFGYMRMSEPEFHEIFAEAIVAGRPDSKEDPEIIIGIGEEVNALWHSNPRFATYVHNEHGAEDADGNQAQSSQSIQGRLATVRNSEEALAVLLGACIDKFAMILQVSAEAIDPSAQLLKLGIDSLVAVEIRSWFLKEVHVDIPVLKILGGSSLADICQDALAMLPPSMINSLETDPPQPETEVNDNKTLQTPVFGNSRDVSPAPTGTFSSQADGTSGTPLTTPSASEAGLPEKKANEDEHAYERMGEMSPGQSRLYFLHLYLEDKTTYNVTMSGQLRGPLEIARLRRALNTIAMKHEGLRTSFFLDSATGKAMQGVGHEPHIIFEHSDVQDDSEVQAAVDTNKRFNFDLEAGLWMKVHVLSRSWSQHHIVFTFHHIALDGVSWGIFLTELDQAYAGKDVGLPRQQALDLSDKRREEREPARLRKELQFWRDTFDSVPETLPLFPISRVQCRHLLKAYDTAAVDVVLEAPVVRQIKQASSELQITSFHFYLSAIASFISRCIGVDDFVIGILDANRNEAEERTTMGYFTNLLPLRFRMNAGERFNNLARRTRDNTFAALSHANADFDTILDTLKVSRSGDQNPLFQIAVNYRMGGSKTMPLGKCEIEWTSSTDARNPYDLIIDISEIAEGTIISFTTQSYLYSAADTRMLMTWYLRSLEGFATNTSRLASDCSLGASLDIQHAVDLGRGDRIVVEWQAPTLAHRIHEMATLNTKSIAIKDGYGRRLTYRAMMDRVNYITSQLRDLSAGSYVGVLLHPNADAICALLAIMDLGLVYVPLDLRNPAGRLAAIVADCRPSVIICQGETLSSAKELLMAAENSKVDLLNVSTLIEGGSESLQAPATCVARPHDPGFAIYTSGSTSTPKGVLLTHAALLNQIWAISKLFGIGKEVVLQQSSFGFDLSLEQIFSALANGGTLVVASKEARGDAIQISNLILSEGVTYTEFVPSEYLYLLRYGYHILKACSSWKYAFSGGEKVTAQLRRGFKKLGLSNLRLVNLYGPAEATLSCTRCVIPYTEDDIEDESPAGRVMPNYSVVIVDENMNPMPAGFPGEICIGGAGNAVGYVNRPEETARKFVPNRISPSQDSLEGWDKLYRTGDKGRMLESGFLHFMGRLDGDSQVKIRGMRIELEEIAKVIVSESRSAIVDAAVSLRSSDLLVAFVVFSDDFTGDKSAFLEQLKACLPLPAYMSPTNIVAIDEIPRSPNGKRDKSKIDSLPVPSSQDASELYEENLTDLEAQVVAVWQEVLPGAVQLSRLTSDADFFLVGGNSLLLLKLRTELRMAFGCDVTLPELFRASTIRGMASTIRTATYGEQILDQEIDWSTEIRALCDGLSPDALAPPAIAVSNPDAGAMLPKTGLCVVLTGATGFLGRHILDCLVRDKRVGEVHCISIRSNAKGEPRHVAVTSPKVIEYTGDLADRNLGLSNSELEQLTTRADVFIHNGADVSFMKTYRSLRRPNVLATRRLAEMALAASASFHFVSTASVARFYPGDSLPEVSIQATELLPVDGQHGYEASKWVGEALLEALAVDYGLRSWIHRPTSIAGEGVPEMDIVTTLYAYCKLLHAVPRFHGAVSGAFDFVPVRAVAEGIADAALDSVGVDTGRAVRASCEYLHHCSDVKVSLQSLRRHMEEEEGVAFDELDFEVWLERARDAGLGELVNGVLKSALENEQTLTLPVIHRGSN